MFGLLSPIALAGLALLAIPVLLHIFKPQRVRQVPFTSLRWLRGSEHRLSRRIRWHQLLLLLLRVAFLALLVLALAGPILSVGARRAPADRFIVIDTSRGMGYQAGEASAPIDRAKEVAQQLLSQSIAGDRTAIMLAGSVPRLLGPLVTDAEVHLPKLRKVAAGQLDIGLSQILSTIGAMDIGGREDAAVELFFLTDNHSRNWSQPLIARYVNQTQRPLYINIIDLGDENIENARIAAARLVESQHPRRRTIQVGITTTGRKPKPRTVHITGLDGLGDVLEPVRPGKGGQAQLKVDIPYEYALKGKVAKIQLEPADAMPNDDVYWLNLDASGAVRVLIVEADSGQIETLQQGFHLRAALESLATTAPGSLQISRRPHNAVLAVQVSEADLIIMVDVPLLSGENLQAIERHVKRGGGLLVFLGPSINGPFYNNRMHNPIRPHDSLLPMIIKNRVRHRRADRVLPRISDVQWSHPLLITLFDPIYGDLGQVRFKNYYQVELVNRSDRTQALASIESGSPAIVSHQLGAGKVIVLNTTANDAWSDLPRRKSFIPLIDSIIQYLTTGPQRGTFDLSLPVILNVPTGTDASTVKITAPDGQTIKVSRHSIDGRNTIRIDNLKQAGVYWVKHTQASGQTDFPIVVQPANQPAGMARIDEQTLRNWWQPADVRLFRSNTPASAMAPAERRGALAPWLIVLACLALITEMFFVHWLCPASTPRATSTPVIAANHIRQTGAS